MKKHIILLASIITHLSCIISTEPNAVQSVVSALHHIQSTAQQVLNQVDQSSQQAVHTIVQQAKDALQKIVEKVPHDQLVEDALKIKRNMFDYVEQAVQEVADISIEALQEIEQNPQDVQLAQTILKDTYYALQQAIERISRQTSQQHINATPELLPTELVNIKDHVQGIKIDNRYASRRNITGQKILSAQAPCMLSYKTVTCLRHVQENLNAQGFGIVVWQAYQSDEDQQRICDLVHNEQLLSWCPAVSEGRKLSVSMYQLTNGRPVVMPTDFQNITIKARPDCIDISSKALKNRDILTTAMQRQGFEQSSYYWWCFYLPKQKAQ